MFEEYLISFHSEDLLEILSNPEKSKCFSININFIELHERKIELANALLREPEAVLEEWDKAALSAQMALIKQQTTKCELKIKVHCRIHYLAHLARHSSVFPGNKDAGKFLQISGTVMHITAPKLLEYQRNYVCIKCKSPAIVKAIYDRKYIIHQPVKCQNPEGCDGTNLVHFGGLDSENCKDYQEIKIQEQVKKLGMGSIPNTIWVTLEDDLVDSCQPGDDVTVCGIVKRRFGEFIIGKRPEIDLVVKANHVQVDTNSSLSSVSTPETLNMFKNFFEKYADNPLEGRNIILKSYCPQIYGLYPVKLAIAVILAGGCSTQDATSTGVRTRSESHLLLVGDPGTGKSQLLKFAAKVIPRSVLTTGIGSTAAGLTVTATMERGEWQLEAGALVLADGGICCIDEFNSMKEHDRTSIHEAMEQQTISVAKASIVCKLNTRCSILAACNPKGNLDPKQPLPMNVALPSPLLSRFDLIMMLRDTVNQEWDERVIDYILNDGHNISKLTDFGLWPINILQTYFKLIKKLQPKLTEDAETILSTYYNIQRRMTSRNKARTTVRLLESLVRLSQGHARLMYHEKVLVIDSIYAVFLVDISMGAESSLFNLDMAANSIFPEKTKASYRNLLETVLNKMQLFDILEKESSKISVGGEGPLQSRFFKNPRENPSKNAEINSNNEADRITEENSNLKSQDICNVGKVETNGTENQPTDSDNNFQFSKIEINKSASVTAENNKQSDCDNNKTKNIDKTPETENKALTDIDNNQVPNSSSDADKIKNVDMPSTSEHKKQSKPTNVDLPSSTENKKRSLHDKGPIIRNSKNSNKRSKTCTSSLDSVQNDLDVLNLIPSNIHLGIDCGSVDVPSGSNCTPFCENKTENFDDLNSIEGIDFDL